MYYVNVYSALFWALLMFSSKYLCTYLEGHTVSPPPPTDKYQTRGRSPSPSPSAPPRSPAPWPRSGPEQFYIRNMRRRLLLVPSPCVQCRYLRLSWVGSGESWVNVCCDGHECLLRDCPSPITVIVHTNQLYTDQRSTVPQHTISHHNTTNIDPPYPRELGRVHTCLSL